jgi:hypothetical protein
MSFLGHPVTGPKDNLDELLRAFFQAEMPSPWPTLEAPEPQPILLPAKRPWSMTPLKRSRLALAASVALLVGGSLFMAGHFEGQPPETLKSPGGGTAEQIDPLKVRIRENLIQEPDGTGIHIEIYEQVPMK